MILGTENRQRRRRLRLPEGVHESDRGRERLDRAADDRERHRGAAIREALQAREVARPELGRVEELLHHRRHEKRMRHALALDEAKPRRGVELAHQHERPSGEERRHDRRRAGDVVERHAHERRAARRAVGELDGAADVGREIVVREEHALR